MWFWLYQARLLCCHAVSCHLHPCIVAAILQTDLSWRLSIAHSAALHSSQTAGSMYSSLNCQVIAVSAVQTQQDFQQQWRSTAQHYFGSSGHQLHQSGSRVSITPSQASRQRHEGNSATGPREPRPYYYRVQQQMQAGMANQAQRRYTQLLICCIS